MAGVVRELAASRIRMAISDVAGESWQPASRETTRSDRPALDVGPVGRRSVTGVLSVA